MLKKYEKLKMWNNLVQIVSPQVKITCLNVNFIAKDKWDQDGTEVVIDLSCTIVRKL